jgi:hypothetical protein
MIESPFQLKTSTVKVSPDISEDRLASDWTLTEADIVLTLTCKGDDSCLRFAMQLCALRNTGRFLQQEACVPLKAVNYLAQQIELEPVLFAPLILT